MGGWPFTLFVAAASAGMGAEWARISRRDPAEKPVGAVAMVLALAALTGGVGLAWLGLAVALAAVAALAMARLPRAAWGLAYIAPGVLALGWLRADPAVGFVNTLFTLLVVWAGDIGAYAVGRLVGGPKLAPAISPGKTRSGAVGGLAASVLIAAGVALYLGGNPAWAGLIGAVVGVAGQAGDLLESGLKRRFGVKDSGGLIPGHGGLLDRLDALLVAVPVAALLAAAAGRGVELWR